MKNLIVLVVFITSLNFAKAQSLNDKGLYVDSEGNLFTGTIEKTQNAIKADYSVKDGVISGEVTYYYASGNKMETGVFTNGQKDQKWVRYNDNGSTAAIAFYNLGKKTGTWIVYDETGKKRFEMNYMDNEKTGTWTNWDENGVVVNTKTYNSL